MQYIYIYNHPYSILFTYHIYVTLNLLEMTGHPSGRLLSPTSRSPAPVGDSFALRRCP